LKIQKKKWRISSYSLLFPKVSKIVYKIFGVHKEDGPRMKGGNAQNYKCVAFSCLKVLIQN